VAAAERGRRRKRGEEKEEEGKKRDDGRKLPGAAARLSIWCSKRATAEAEAKDKKQARRGEASRGRNGRKEKAGAEKR
jgi:hypothetical protein